MSGRKTLPETLDDSDFPRHFVNGRHPQDYQPVDAPINPECIVVNSFVYNRLILRVSWKVEATFVPMSFILETRLSSGFYFSDVAYSILSDNKRLEDSEERFYKVASVHYGSKNSTMLMAALRSPEGFENANFIGANALMRFGLKLGDPEGGFSFQKNISWL
jgi:hypothetical protein